MKKHGIIKKLTAVTLAAAMIVTMNLPVFAAYNRTAVDVGSYGAWIEVGFNGTHYYASVTSIGGTNLDAWMDGTTAWLDRYDIPHPQRFSGGSSQCSYVDVDGNCPETVRAIACIFDIGSYDGYFRDQLTR